MRYVSLFSGIEAATVAWGRLGWQPVAFAEVDEFPAAVLANRFPDVPNLGDVRNIDWEDFHERNGNVDVLVGGSPCQNFSVAGNRLGVLGEQSRLMFEYVRAIRDLVRASGGRSPRYIVWENVPGCLSSNEGRDFGCLLDELEDCGYCLAWRTLDSQFARVFDRSSGRFGRPVPQRRRRVYLVGCLGDGGPEEILFERSCLRGDHPKGGGPRDVLAEGDHGGPALGCGVMSMSSCRHRAAIDDGITGTLDAGHEQPIFVIDRAAFNQGRNALYRPHIEEADVMDTLVARGPHAVCYLPAGTGGGGYVVRRVTPVETERLQAFPDGWTDLSGCDAESVAETVASSLGIDAAGDAYGMLRRKIGRWSRSCPDGLRYKATGNSITTTVLEIIGRRIQAYDELHYDEVGIGLEVE